MKDMNNVYIEEAKELLKRLEDALLQLENNPQDIEGVEEVFRVMHTLKGNSSMFGLNEIAAFVHNLETIYDNVREGKQKVTKKLLDITLKSLDHLNEIVNDLNFENEDNKKYNQELTTEILDFINEVEISNDKPNENIEEAIDSEQINFYHIFFKPSSEVLKNGTNPFFLIDEVCSLGKGFVLPNFNPDSINKFEDFDPGTSYISWDIFLETNADINKIKDVFVFVEDESEIEIENYGNKQIIQSELFSIEIASQNISSKRIDKEQIKELVSKSSEVLTQNLPFTKENTTKDNQSNNLPSSTQKEKSISSIRVTSDKLDELMNLVSELVTSQAGLSLYFKENQDERLEVITENIEKLTRQLRDTAFSMTLVPLNSIFYRFQRLVRDLSSQLNKDVEFVTNGGDTDLDKTIIEALTDPLLHLLRNCIDHGIESSEDRKKAGKKEKGKISLNAYYSGANVHILIKDNGKGIDLEQIKFKALEKGIIHENHDLSDKEILDLIFTPGFSTAKKITDVSGRGVGMDVVKRNIMDLRGDINLYSELGQGTTVEIILPLTLSIIDGLLVRLDETHYVIPLSAVEKCHEIEYGILQRNFNKLIKLDESQIPFLNLRKEFKASRNNDPKYSQVIVIHNEGAKIGICVDEIIGEYQAVLKPIGKYYSSQEFISGATILGDGTIALVLDTYKIIEKKVNQKNLVA
ncbi:MAG: chemotaxis protein CheA [Vicingaceae bacterium]|nr:chemotaxis protein CheA [Vicingaceae bacterium]